MIMPSEAGYKVGQDNLRIFGLDIHNPVFFVSGGIIVLFVFFSAIFQRPATTFFGWLRPALTGTFDWFLAMRVANWKGLAEERHSIAGTTDA